MVAVYNSTKGGLIVTVVKLTKEKKRFEDGGGLGVQIRTLGILDPGPPTTKTKAQQNTKTTFRSVRSKKTRG